MYTNSYQTWFVKVSSESMDSYQYHILHAQMYLEQRKVYVDQSHLHSYHKSLINILEQLVRFLPSIYVVYKDLDAIGAIKKFPTPKGPNVNSAAEVNSTACFSCNTTSICKEIPISSSCVTF